MTPLTLAEQSFLKLDAPQQAKPAASQGSSGAGFGNIMSEARENAEAAPEAVVTDAAPEAAAVTPEQTTDAEIIQLPTKPATKGEAVQADAATTDLPDLPDLPVIARLPEGGLTTKANPDTAPRKTAEVAKVQPAKEQVLDPAANTLPDTGTANTDVATDTEKPAEAPVLKVVQTTTPIETDAVAVTPEPAETVQQTTPSETMQALTASTSGPALTAGTAAETKVERPATTHASLALRAQMGKKAAPANAQGPQQANAHQTVKPAKAVDAAEGPKAVESTAIATGEPTPAQSINVETAEQSAPELQTAAPTDTTPQTPEQLAAAATVAAPIAAKQSDRTPTQPRTERAGEKAAPIAAQQSDRTPTQPRTERAGEKVTIQRGPKPQQTQTPRTTTTEAKTEAEPTQRRIAPEAKQSVAAQSFEQMIQQAVSEDTPLETALTKLITTDSAPAPQTQTALPQIAPQIQVATSPEAFQPQLESAPRDIATRELSMEQADWPETMVQDIGFETLADGEAIDIQLTPENMGRVQLRMEMRDGTASIMIVTETAEAAKQFNDNQQKLADLLAKQGVELASHNASAGRDFGQQGQGGRNGGEGTASNQTQTTGGTGQTEAQTARKDPNRLVDVQA